MNQMFVKTYQKQDIVTYNVHSIKICDKTRLSKPIRQLECFSNTPTNMIV